MSVVDEAQLFEIEQPPPVSLADKFGVPAVRAERPFRATRKLTRVHQHLLIFVKGDAKRAATRLEDAS